MRRSSLRFKKKVSFCNEYEENIKWTGIPVSIGLAKTKTLAKMQTELLKKSILI